MIPYLLTLAVFLLLSAWLLIALHLCQEQLTDSRQREQILAHALGNALTQQQTEAQELLEQKIRVLRDGWIRETAQHITDAYADGYQAGCERNAAVVGAWRRVH